MIQEKRETGKKALPLEPRQYRFLKNKNETVINGIIKGLFYLSVAAVFYFVIFTHAQKVLDLVTSKTYTAPLVAMAIVLVAAGLIGTGINKLIKSTLERALESQKMREE